MGQIIRVRKDHYFPCDIALLDYPIEHPTAFIETKNLDGETNLKLKKTCQHLESIRGTADLDLYSWRAEFSFEKPNPFLSTLVIISEKRNSQFPFLFPVKEITKGADPSDLTVSSFSKPLDEARESVPSSCIHVSMVTI